MTAGVIALVVLLLGFAAGWQTHAWKAGAAEALRLQAEQSDQAARRGQVNQAAQQHEEHREAIRAEARVIEKEVDRVVEAPVYRDRCLDDDGLRLVARAVGAAGGDLAQPAAALPAASAPE